MDTVVFTVVVGVVVVVGLGVGGGAVVAGVGGVQRPGNRGKRAKIQEGIVTEFPFSALPDSLLLSESLR